MIISQILIILIMRVPIMMKVTVIGIYTVLIVIKHFTCCKRLHISNFLGYTPRPHKKGGPCSYPCDTVPINDQPPILNIIESSTVMTKNHKIIYNSKHQNLT